MLADKLTSEDRGQKARVLAGKMLNAIPRFEATEEVCAFIYSLAYYTVDHSSRFQSMSNSRYRRESDVNTARFENSSSSDQNQTFPCTRDEHEASG